MMQVLEKIPAHCQQLQVLVKSPTVGKPATFNKVSRLALAFLLESHLLFSFLSQVDSVIQETKNLMNEIAKLVTNCFVCATKVRRRCLSLVFFIAPFSLQFEIEFRNASFAPGGRPPSLNLLEPDMQGRSGSASGGGGGGDTSPWRRTSSRKSSHHKSTERV